MGNRARAPWLPPLLPPQYFSHQDTAGLEQTPILSADSPAPAPPGFAPPHPCPGNAEAKSFPKGRHLPLLQQTAPVSTEPDLLGAHLNPAVALWDAPYSSHLFPTTASQQDPNTTLSSSSCSPSSPSSRVQERGQERHRHCGMHPSLSPAPGDSGSLKAHCFDVGKSTVRRRRLSPQLPPF